MTLYREKDIPLDPRDIVFRQSSLYRGVAVIFMLGLLALGLLARDRLFLPCVCTWTTVTGLGSLLFLMIFIKTFGRSNWLVRCNEQGLVIKFRSYLNKGDPEDVVAVGLRYSEIAWVRRRVARVVTTDMEGSTTIKRRTYLDIKTTGSDSDLSQLRQAILAERRRPSRNWAKSKSKDNSVRVVDRDLISITWWGPYTWVAPGIKRVLAVLSSWTSVHPETHVTQDLR